MFFRIVSCAVLVLLGAACQINVEVTPNAPSPYLSNSQQTKVATREYGVTPRVQWSTFGSRWSDTATPKFLRGHWRCWRNDIDIVPVSFCLRDWQADVLFAALRAGEDPPIQFRLVPSGELGVARPVYLASRNQSALNRWSPTHQHRRNSRARQWHWEYTN